MTSFQIHLFLFFWNLYSVLACSWLMMWVLGECEGAQPHIAMGPASPDCPPIQAGPEHWAESPVPNSRSLLVIILNTAARTCPPQTPWLPLHPLSKALSPDSHTLRWGARATPWALRPLLNGRDLVLFLQHSKTEAVTRAYIHIHICT